ncbi:MAG: hypothetical protein ACK4LR_11860 [Acidovorax temperans]|uniref:hypothetical protein n=1 Tax=Acidovorax temperans TaxID=80878 RepID=UPI003919E959
MQISHIDAEQLCELLETGERLATLDYGPQRVEVLHWSGVDLLAVVCPVTGGAVVVSPCAEDGDSGGSVHAHARQMMAA